MKYSEQMDKIAKALLAVQKEIEPVFKDSTNPHFKNKYVSLDSMTEYLRPILAEHGCIILQGGDSPSDPQGQFFFIDVVTTIMHESGQYVTSTVRMPLDKANPQGAGSALTYGRRYGLGALLAITTDEDDDGQKATFRNEQSVVKSIKSVAEQTGHTAPPRQATQSNDSPACPICGSDMWDNRPKKRSGQFKANASDFRCKDKACKGAIWLKDDKPAAGTTEIEGYDDPYR